MKLFKCGFKIVRIRINQSKVERTIKPFKSKRIGKTYDDNRIAISNPSFGNLRIIGTENNDHEDCRIVVYT